VVNEVKMHQKISAMLKIEESHIPKVFKNVKIEESHTKVVNYC